MFNSAPKTVRFSDDLGEELVHVAEYDMDEFADSDDDIGGCDDLMTEVFTNDDANMSE